MKIADILVQNGEDHDDILHNKSMPVNIRLLKENKAYYRLICGIIKHMEFCAKLEFEDYPGIQGISGANVGIPFNIVIIAVKGGHSVFLNPEVVARSKELVKCMSNCGSVNLPEKVKVMRHRWVRVKYYDTSGYPITFTSRIDDTEPVSCATLQHEIEHNLGILITDKEV